MAAAGLPFRGHRSPHRLKSQFATIGGIRTHFVREGTGRPLFLLHGQTPGSCVETEWFRNIDYFAQAGYSVFAFDQPGFGRTDNPADYSIAARIAHTRAFIDWAAPKHYALWGCSMGSYIAADLARSGDRRIERMVFMPSSVLPPPSPQGPTAEGQAIAAAFRDYVPSPESARRVLGLILARPESITDALVQRFHEMSSGKNHEALQQRKLQPRPPAIHDSLRDVEVPTLLLWGDRDPGAPPERVLALLAIMPRAELHFLRGHKHWPHIEDSARVHRLVHEFLAANGLEDPG